MKTIKIFIMVVLIFLLFVLSLTGYSDIYKYTDEKGNIVFTDSPPAGDKNIEKIESESLGAVPSKTPLSPGDKIGQPSEFWKEELNRLCKDNLAHIESLSEAELQKYIESFDSLKSIIEASSVSSRLKPSYFMQLNSCKRLYKTEYDIKKQRRGYNDLEESLKRKLKK